MKKANLIFPFLLAGVLFSAAARADTFSTAIGGGVGAVAGAFVGDSMGGRNGAIVGSGVGGALGAVVGQSISQRSYRSSHGGGYAPVYGYREVHHYEHSHHRHPGRGHARGHYKQQHHSYYRGYAHR